MKNIFTNNALLAFIGALLGTIISSYFSIIKIRTEYSIQNKIKYLDSINENLIKNGLDVIVAYNNTLLDLLHLSNVRTKKFVEYKTLSPPFSLAQNFDSLYNTNWTTYILFIHNSFNTNIKSKGGSLDANVLNVINQFQKEVVFYRNLQQTTLNASLSRILYWRFCCFFKFYFNRKQLKTIVCGENIKK